MPAPHVPKLSPPISLVVGDGRYLFLNSNPGPQEDHPFKAHTPAASRRDGADALPFCGRVEYASELGLWFGFSSKLDWQFAASDLGAASGSVGRTRDTTAGAVGPGNGLLLPLGAGKFCIARVFDMADEDWRRENDGNNYMTVESFVVFTGVEVERGSRGALRMIRHMSRSYSCGHMLIQILL